MAQGLPNFNLPPPPPPATREGITTEVGAEIAAQTDPLSTQAELYARQQEQAVNQLNALFGNIQPYVAQSAQNVAQTYGASQQAQQGIFAEATNRLNALHQQRAAEAQALAQQLGAPIPMSMFTDPTDVESAAFAPEAAGQLLHSQGIAQAGVQEAEAFAGKVFPLKRTELETQTRNAYRDQIFELNKQIASIKSTAPGLINERLRQRQLEDYQARLDSVKTQFDMWRQKQEEKRAKTSDVLARRNYQLQVKQANRDWWLQRHTLTLEQQKLKAQIAEVQGQLASGAADRATRIKLQKMQNKYSGMAAVNARKQQIAAASAAIWHGPTTTERKVMVQDIDPLTNKVKGAHSETITVPVPASRANNPNKVLARLLATSGTTQKERQLYQYAVEQVKNLFRMRGYTHIPNDQKQWDKWWAQVQARGKSKPNPRGGAPMNPGPRTNRGYTNP